MNKELELEAEKYAWKKKNPFSKEILANELVFASKTDFIEGANSKYVEKQKLEFAIEQYKIIMDNQYCPFPLFTFCKKKIKELEQRLSELKNEPTNT